jgi:hypothetical protein
MNYVKIVSTFYDNIRRVVGTDFTYTNVDLLKPAEKSSFEIILNDATQSQKVSSYKLSASGDKTQALHASLKLSVGDSHLDSTGDFHLVGEVTNQGSQKAAFVKVSGAFYNSSNSVVAADFTYTDPQDLEPGQTAPFEIIVHAPTADKITYASVNVGSNQYSSINSQVVQVSPNVKSSSSSSTTTKVSHSSIPILKSLSVSIRVAHDPISRGSMQTISVKVSEKSNSSKPISGANVNGRVVYASHQTTNTFSGVTDDKGEIDPYSWQIGGHSNTGTFPVNVDVSSKGYTPASATKSFTVTAVVPTPQNTTNTTNTTITNTTTVLPGNNTSSGDNDNSTNDNNTSTSFNPLIPSSGNLTENGIDQQGQTGNGGNNATITGDDKDKVISNPTTGGNFSDIGTHGPLKLHHNSKHKHTTGNDKIETPGGGSGGGSSGSSGSSSGK